MENSIGFRILNAVRKYCDKNPSAGFPSVLFLGPSERRELSNSIKELPSAHLIPEMTNDDMCGSFTYQGMSVRFLARDGCLAGHVNDGDLS